MVIGYARGSTEDQSKDGASLAHQIAKIRACAELKDSELVEIVEDDGISAKTSSALAYSISWNWPGLNGTSRCGSQVGQDVSQYRRCTGDYPAV